MRKVTLVTVLAFLVFSGGSVFAQNWNSFSPNVANSKVVINGGIGFGLLAAGYELGIPPISVSADFKLPMDLPITLGPIVALSSRTFSFSSTIPGTPAIPGYPPYTPDIPATPAKTYGYEFTYTNFAIGARGMWHFNFSKSMDVYTGLTLGYVVSSADAKYTGDWAGAKTAALDLSYFLFGFNVGARYFFTDSLGAYAELGYSGLQFFGLGLSLKI